MQNSPSVSISLQNSLDISEPFNIFENDLNKIKMQRLEHFNTLIDGHLNINSIRNKFEMIAKTITNFDIFLISESKTYSSFPNMQFKINGYKPFRRDRKRWRRGGNALFKRKNLCKFLYNHPIVPNAEIICSEFHQLKCEWLLLGCYKPPIQNDVNDLLQIYDLTVLIKELTCYQSSPSCIDHFLTN